MFEIIKIALLFLLILSFYRPAVLAEEIQKPYFYQEWEMRLVEIKLKSPLRPKNRYTNYDFGPKINCRGMIIAPGLVITAKHCTNFPDFLITINDLPAKVLATSQADLAILKVPSFLDCDLPPLNLLLYPSSRIATVRKFPNSGFFWQWGAIKKSGRRDIFHKQ